MNNHHNDRNWKHVNQVIINPRSQMDHALSSSFVSSGDPIWEIFYKNQFPNFSYMESREDSEVDQIAGIDRVIYLKNNKSITIDEKVRYVNYPDILIEEYSDMDRGAMGWIEKPLTIDFVAYHIIPAKKIYLLDFRLLQRVWRKNKAKWKKLYQSKKAHNISSNGKEYCSLSWPIPIDELLVAMTMENIFTFSGENNIIT